MDISRAYDAPMNLDGPVPAYRVVEVEGPFEMVRTIFDENTRELSQKPYLIEKGYMVLFPQGHSMMLDSLEALEAHGFGGIVPLIKLGQEAEMSQEHAPTTTKRVIEKA